MQLQLGDTLCVAGNSTKVLAREGNGFTARHDRTNEKVTAF